ncbi:MAG: manganese efflux pump [bacterium]
MIEQLILLTLALSLDSFGIGLSYGIRNIRFRLSSICIIGIVSYFLTSLSIYAGKLLGNIFSEKIVNLISILILVVIGLFIIKKAVEEEEVELDIEVLDNRDNKEKINKDIIINIIKDPSFGDLNHSSIIDPIEAIFLAIAISIDALGVGLAVSDFKSAYLFPIFIILFQFLFLFTGMFVGKNMFFERLDENKIGIISGSMLVMIAGFRIFLN